MTPAELLDYYRSPGSFTDLGRFGAEVDALEFDVGAVAKIVQGLLIHEAWAAAYKVVIPAERSKEKQLHGARAMLDCALRLDARPLTEARSPDCRVVGVCRHFATLFVAIARRKRVPARARCGFANYFEAGKHFDHWVAEYWNEPQRRWILVDAQIDDVQARLVKPPFDVLDVPRDRFLVAGDAWAKCRNGSADAQTFGVAGTEMWGLTEVFGDVWQDVASLQKIELLPWGWYGLATADGAAERHADFVDRVARLSSRADADAIDELLRLAADDVRLVIPSATLDAIEAVEGRAS
jgi:hypothetical protein